MGGCGHKNRKIGEGVIFLQCLWCLACKESDAENLLVGEGDEDGLFKSFFSVGKECLCDVETKAVNGAHERDPRENFIDDLEKETREETLPTDPQKEDQDD